MMTLTTDHVEKTIFQQDLDADENTLVSQMIRRAKTESALTQQLAIDASRLVTLTEERLEKQSNTGFFKRFANAVSGKNTENQLQNQTDLIQMQKFAWHYLKQLQQQNLINAQGIAVIRNNMGAMNDYIIETRDFLEEAIDKIDRRLKSVENNASFNKWSLNIEANKRRYKSIPQSLLILNLTYDFVRSHRQAILSGAEIDSLIVTLETLGINCDEEIVLLEFVIQLIDDIDVMGIDRYRNMIDVSFDDHTIESSFIQKNISGIGFNTFYFLSDEYEKIIDVISDTTLCADDEARAKFISKIFGAEFSGLTSRYSVRDLVAEVVGGNIIAVDLYKDLNGLNVVNDDEIPEQQAEIITLVSVLPDIKTHTFLDADIPLEQKENYLRLLALSVDNSGAVSKIGQEFLAQLTEKAGCPYLHKDINLLADSSRKFQEYQPVMVDLLNDDDKAYTWLADAFFLLTLSQINLENHQILKVLNILKPTGFKENFTLLRTLLTESDAQIILSATAALRHKTRGWKNILQYRELSFDECFKELENKLYKSEQAVSAILWKLMDVSTSASEHSFYFDSGFDEGFLNKVASTVGSSACTLGRKLATSNLNDCRKKASDALTEHRSVLSQANQLFRTWNIPPFEFKDNISALDYDLDNSASNENWYDLFSQYERQIDNTLNEFSTACSDSVTQLSYFKKGEFDKSVADIKAQKKLAWQEQQRQEKLAKQSVTLTLQGHDHRLNIEWGQVENPPCDPEKIRDIKTDGVIWLVTDDNHNIYRSDDGQIWHQVAEGVLGESPYIRKIEHVENVWFVFMGYNEPFAWSPDAIVWHKGQYPSLPDPYDFSSTENLIFCNGLWLWRFTERKEYEYTEKGIFFDSAKKSTYTKSHLYVADEPGGEWTRWEYSPSFNSGVTTEDIYALPGTQCLLTFCKYDSYYIHVKKMTDRPPFVRYLVPGKEWKDGNWDGDLGYIRNAIFTRQNNKLVCFYSDKILISDKGFDWRKIEQEAHVANTFSCGEFTLHHSQNGSNRLWFSQNMTFLELMLEEGNWQYLHANPQGVLSVYAPDSHETYLQLGKFVSSLKS